MPRPLPGRPSVVLAVMLLTASSGLVDAVVYMLHHQVFANAMTGNLVLLGVAFTAHDRLHVWWHLVPLLGFVCGVSFGKYLLRRHRALSLRAALLLQIAVLTAAGSFAAQLPFTAVVSALAVSGAVIITVIRRVGEVAFNITFMTGNLRGVVESAFDAVLPAPHPSPTSGLPAAPARRQFAVTGPSVLGFLLGAAAGAFAAVRFGNHSFFFCVALLFAAGILLRNVPGAEA